MDPDKIAFLFDDVPEGLDADDEEDRALLVAGQLGPDDDLDDAATRFRLTVHTAIANQIALDQPPDVWEAAQRMTAMGVDRASAIGNLVLAFLGPLHTTLSEQSAFDEERYRQRLSRLPLPTPDQVEEALVAIARERQPVGAGELLAAAADRFGYAPDDELFHTVADQAFDDLLEGRVLDFAGGDAVVHVPSLLADVVLTHTITEAEVATDTLAGSFDLAPFADALGPDLVTADGVRLAPLSADRGHIGWRAPKGWLADLGAGTTIAVRMPGFAEADWFADELAVEVARLDACPTVDPDLVDAVGAVYAEGTEESGLPLGAEDIVLGLVAADRSRFATPTAPLSTLCDAVGLERRASEVAHHLDQWARSLRLRRLGRLYGSLDGHDIDAAIEVLGALDPATGDPVPDATTRRTRQKALTAMHRDPVLLTRITFAVLGEDDHEAEADAEEIAGQLLEAAQRDPEKAVAHWFAAVVAERHRAPEVAQDHLRAAAVAGPAFGPAVERLAWYLSDRGQARDAMRLLDRLAPDVAQDDRRELRRFTAAAGPTLGRNEPCWCGSGRKFKHCHQGRPAVARLRDRTSWLSRKAIGFLERRYLQPPAEILDLAAIRAGSDRFEDMARAFEDPLVLDVALHEEGWFADFVAHRGALLPDDERLLAAAWQLVDRSIHEIVEVRRDEGMTLRDLRAGDVIEVQEQALTRQVAAGTLLCARVVPDGEDGHQIVGGVFAVAPGTEATVLDILDRGDGGELLAYRAHLDLPPELRSREGERSVRCRAVLTVPDRAEAEAVLDGIYEREGEDGEPRWIEWHRLNEDERIVRAWVRFDDGELVAEAMSEERMDRVLDRLREALPGAAVRSDERAPFDPGDTSVSFPPVPSTPMLDPDDPDVVAAMESIRSRMEARWCDEAVPALGGRTPRQAAADPTRRESLVRLIASLPDPDDGPSAGDGLAFGFRPGRLRALLGIDPDE